jgi:hypothetical protein
VAILTDEDIAQMRAEQLAIRDDNPSQITIRRGTLTLAAQTVRVAHVGGAAGYKQDSGPAESHRTEVTILGATDLDIAVKDTFVLNGGKFVVTWIRLDRRIATFARAEALA